MNRIPVLTHLDLLCLWATSSGVVPVPSGASVMVFKQGITTTVELTFDTNGVGKTIVVAHTGACRIGGHLLYVKNDQSTSHGLAISDVQNDASGSRVIASANDGAPYVMPMGTRLLYSDVPAQNLVYPDALGAGTPELFLVVDQYGVARGVNNQRGGYIKERIYDIYYVGAAGEGPRILMDQIGGWVMR